VAKEIVCLTPPNPLRHRHAVCHPSGHHALRGSRRTLHDSLDHHGRDAREHGLGLRGPQYVDNRVRPLRLLLRLGVATGGDVPELTGPMQIGELSFPKILSGLGFALQARIIA